jgi:glycosyltransferase involved in cell wall biosynthesis
MLQYVSNRGSMRLLLITKDTAILAEGSAANRRIIDLRAKFPEIHVIVLAYREKRKEPVLVQRLFDNVWLYTAESDSWWTLVYDAYTVANTQLVFGGGFRADAIVAEDPFESGMVGWLLSRKHKRTLQLHVYEDCFDVSVIESQEYPVIYKWITRFVIGRAGSVRTKSEFQRRMIAEEYPKLEPVTELLPSFYDLNAWKNVVPTNSLRDRFPQFKFILLHVSSMRAGSRTSEVLSGVADMLRRYPTIGLVIVGNGPLRHHFEKKVIALGLQNQVEFEPVPVEIISYMKTANVYVHLTEDSSEDDLLLQAAVSKLPIIANSNGLAGKLFVHEESACLCAPGDAGCISNSLNRYLNENQERTRFALNAQEIIFDRIEQDYGAYLTAYANSIERSIVASS